ncbi:MAG: hypothetical protein VX777_02345 [Chlamydiota bacterium]|nr:hypothetical protein [Chlamydiota bacterium]
MDNKSIVVDFKQRINPQRSKKLTTLTPFKPLPEFTSIETLRHYAFSHEMEQHSEGDIKHLQEMAEVLQDEKGFTVLHEAVFKNDLIQIQKYAEKLANVKDAKGRTPIFYAHSQEVFDLLFKYDTSWGDADVFGNNFFGKLIEHNQFDRIQKIVESPGFCQRDDFFQLIYKLELSITHKDSLKMSDFIKRLYTVLSKEKVLFIKYPKWFISSLGYVGYGLFGHLQILEELSKKGIFDSSANFECGKFTNLAFLLDEKKSVATFEKLQLQMPPDWVSFKEECDDANIAFLLTRRRLANHPEVTIELLGSLSNLFEKASKRDKENIKHCFQESAKSLQDLPQLLRTFMRSRYSLRILNLMIRYDLGYPLEDLRQSITEYVDYFSLTDVHVTGCIWSRCFANIDIMELFDKLFFDDTRLHKQLYLSQFSGLTKMKWHRRACPFESTDSRLQIVRLMIANGYHLPDIEPFTEFKYIEDRFICFMVAVVLNCKDNEFARCILKNLHSKEYEEVFIALYSNKNIAKKYAEKIAERTRGDVNYSLRGLTKNTEVKIATSYLKEEIVRELSPELFLTLMPYLPFIESMRNDQTKVRSDSILDVTNQLLSLLNIILTSDFLEKQHHKLYLSIPQDTLCKQYIERYGVFACGCYEKEEVILIELNLNKDLSENYKKIISAGINKVSYLTKRKNVFHKLVGYIKYLSDSSFGYHKNWEVSCIISLILNPKMSLNFIDALSEDIRRELLEEIFNHQEVAKQFVRKAFSENAMDFRGMGFVKHNYARVFKSMMNGISYWKRSAWCMKINESSSNSETTEKIQKARQSFLIPKPVETLSELSLINYNPHEFFGRTAVIYQRKKQITAYKFKRPDESTHDFIKEYFMTQCFLSDKRFLSDLPKPEGVFWVKHVPQCVKGTDLPYEEGKPQLIYKYTCKKGYFSLLFQGNIHDEEWSHGRKCFLVDSARQMACGSFPVTANMYHGSNSHFIPINLYKPTGYVIETGTGMISQAFKGVRYPNAGILGCRDVGDENNLDKTVAKQRLPDSFHSMLPSHASGVIVVSELSKLCLVDALMRVNRLKERDALDWTNDSLVKDVGEQLMHAQAMVIHGFTGRELDKCLEFTSSGAIDWSMAAKQLLFWSQNDHNGYISYVNEGKLPDGLYAEHINIDISEAKNATNYSPENGFETDGEQDIGPNNGPWGLIELEKSMYFGALIMLGLNSNESPNLP